MDTNALSLFILAAFCYTAPFIWPAYCCFLIFLFPSFLCVLLIHHHPSKKALFYWSLAITTIHLLAICDALIFMASGSLILRCIPPFILTLYVACYPAVWLLTMRWLLHRHWCHQLVLMQLVLWTIGTWLYVLGIDQELLWIFGRHEGYLFMHPLLPLASWPSCLIFTAFIPYNIVLLWFCMISTIITSLFLFPKSLMVYGMLACALVPPWLCTFDTASYHPVPPWLAKVGHIPLLLPHTIDSHMGTILIDQELHLLQSRYPSLTTVIMPESAWNGLSLASIPYLSVTTLSIRTVVIGGFAQDSYSFFNRLYCFIDGYLTYYYDKQHALPLVERISPYTSALATSLFFQKSPPTIASPNPKTVCIFPDIGIYIPYICSELFFTTVPHDTYPYPILCLVNDWWFRMPHFQQLMVLAARFQAIRWHRPILYISFYYAQFFDEFGRGIPLVTTAQDRYIA